MLWSHLTPRSPNLSELSWASALRGNEMEIEQSEVPPQVTHRRPGLTPAPGTTGPGTVSGTRLPTGLLRGSVRAAGPEEPPRLANPVPTF